MQQTPLEQGVTLMLVGMGTVFVFLTLLVAGMTVMAASICRHRPAFSRFQFAPTVSRLT
ncbi:MAG: OadG family protein [Pseudomonadota bacterium]